jgi:hypothetical protein
MKYPGNLFILVFIFMQFSAICQRPRIAETITINGNVSFSPDSTTFIDYIDSQLAPGVGYDKIIINGDLNLAGILEVLVIDDLTYIFGVVPMEIISVNGNITGEFSSVVLPDDFVEWQLDYGVRVPGKVILYNPNLHFLPVSWLSFDGKVTEEGTDLTWKTASEVNSDYFLVQYSTDGVAFKDLAKVKAAGQSQEILEYKFLHVELKSSVSYYRIKQLDYDGTSDFSKTITITNNLDYQKKNHFYPNPSNGLISFEQQANIIVRDITGKIVLVARNASQNLDLRQLEDGKYFIELDGKSEQLILIR